MIPAPRTYVLRAPGAACGRLVQVHQHREGFIVSDANSCNFNEDGSVSSQTTIGTLDTTLPYEDAIQRAEELVAAYKAQGAELVEVKDYPPREFGSPRAGNGDIYLYANIAIGLPVFGKFTSWGASRGGEK